MIAETRIPIDRACFEAALEGLVLLNLAIMDRVAIPPLYSTGIRYRNGKRRWDHCLDVLRRGTGDCKDLSAWLVAELRRSGRDPGARVTVMQTSPTMLHAYVVCSNGSVIDPTIDFGGAG